MLSPAEGKKAESGLLPREDRIRDEKTIRRIIRNKQIHRTSPLLELFAEPSDHNRIIVICNRKVGSAVRRNRIRRVIYAKVANIWRANNKKLNIVVRVKWAIGNDQILSAEIARIV